MSKKCEKETKRLLNVGSAHKEENGEQKEILCLTNITIGASNVKRWNEVKTAFQCKSDEEFTSLLLDLAQKQLNWKFDTTEFTQNDKTKTTETNNLSIQVSPEQAQKRDHIKYKHKRSSINVKENYDNSNKMKDDIAISSIKQNTFSGILPNKSNNAMENVEVTGNSELTKDNSESIPKTSILKNKLTSKQIAKNSNIVRDSLQGKHEIAATNVKTRKKLCEVNEKVAKKQKNTEKSKIDKQKNQTEYDVRKAPDLEVQIENSNELGNSQVVKSEKNVEDVDNGEMDNETTPTKSKICYTCNAKHVEDTCPLLNPSIVIYDSVTIDQWQKNNEDTNEKEDLENHQQEYAYVSLPNILYFADSSTPHGMSVFTKNKIKAYTQFGPLVGKIIKEVDISEDSNMRDLWEISQENSNIYVSTENYNECNWTKFLRPSSNREGKNVLAVTKNSQLYFVTTRNLEENEELLYWQDDNVVNNKKKMEKTTCGGCNMTFLHPLYYRTHCSVFHDVRYSLTIRKYHCKVCGAAVLGKENIMKHAAELHNGQGAYQCQYCKKFFLRLNYLEMHRTYGCSANPHRSRPLCDFCGRKFCQPQKLKVHIKRMHSDMAEVLKEFQCRNCLKILGSRAALQRHVKEVHQKQVDGSCACSRCGKLFQNKSNLKIHMLTHSGIKPFRCTENNCNAAFTTKQCLQFHYKKVHGFTEDMMPKIQRSVDYTFEAYSGVEDQENPECRGQSKYFGQLNMDKRSDINSDNEDRSLESRSADESLALNSPNDQSVENHDTLETYNIGNVKILSKGSKKWIGDSPLEAAKPDLTIGSKNMKLDETSNLSLEVEDTQHYEPPKLTSNINTYSRHESSNASLLVEAALDSVCSEPNIDIDVSSNGNCPDSLVNNLYTLAHPDTLPDVTYSHADVNESRDINLISPSVNDHISVTDDLNEDLRHSQNIGLDYSTFHQEDFSPATSPIQNRNSFVRDYINVNPPSPQDDPTYNRSRSKHPSPGNSPPRYDFGHSVNNDHISSDDSNGLGVQNLSLHNQKGGLQLDLSIYKSSYNLESAFSSRKDFRMKFDIDSDRKQVYVLDVDDVSKGYDDTNKFGMANSVEHPHVENIESNNLSEKEFESMEHNDIKHKDSDLEASMRASVDIRNKFDLDLDLRIKTYDSIENDLRARAVYEGSNDDFRLKNYEISENLENRNNIDVRNKLYDGLIDTEFRTDRNFEPLVLNSELQGLDMSARSYHNYPNLNRYHHIYSDIERPTVDLRLNYSPPPPSYTHADLLRVVSLDLTPPGRHSVDLSLRSHQLTNSRLLSDHTLSSNPHRLSLDQSRILGTDLSSTRHLTADTRLISVSDMSNRILSDHTTNRLLSNDQLTTNRIISAEQRLMGDESRLLADQPRLLEQSRMLSDTRILPPAPPTNGTISPVPYAPYSVSPSPYHPTTLPPRPHATSQTPPPYHHYSAYY